MIYNAAGNTLAEIVDMKPQRGISTGIDKLDEAVLGLRPAHLVMVGAYSGVGKSSLMADLTIAAAKQVPVAVFSLEMGSELFIQRAIYNYADLNYHSGMSGHLSPKETKRLEKAMKDIDSLNNIYVDDANGSMYPSWILKQPNAPKDSLELAIKKYYDLGCRLFLIDYIQYVNFGFKTESETLRLKSLTGHLHKMTIELGVPIVAFAQLKKEVGDNARKSDNHRPTISDIRDSGYLLNDSDIILLLHRPDYFGNENELSLFTNPVENNAEILICKQRNGPTGTIPVSFHCGSMSWRNKENDGVPI